jgi:hypothetical protein
MTVEAVCYPLPALTLRVSICVWYFIGEEADNRSYKLRIKMEYKSMKVAIEDISALIVLAVCRGLVNLIDHLH